MLDNAISPYYEILREVIWDQQEVELDKDNLCSLSALRELFYAYFEKKEAQHRPNFSYPFSSLSSSNLSKL
jgi:hypothetical protein